MDSYIKDGQEGFERLKNDHEKSFSKETLELIEKYLPDDKNS